MIKTLVANYQSPALAVAGIIITAIISLIVLDRVWWCQAGDYSPWSWTVLSRHNSQHIIDPYSFTHILHGVLEFWLIGLVFTKMPMAWRFVLAIFIESSWEVVENTNYIINRYREATISLDYYGDSIVNSIADIACCATGFAMAYKIRFWWSLFVFVMTEAVLILTIRDSLLINLVMLLYPIEWVKHWQGVAA